MTRVCVVGAGTMGRGIAAAMVAAGLDTTLVDVDELALERAREDIPQVTTDLEAAVAGVDVVVEAVPELVELKRDLFERLDRSAPDGALLVTNTSTLSITRLAEVCGRPERVIGMHFFNPVHRMALVEVVLGDRTSEEAVSRALELAAQLGKEPIVVKDAPGFVSSRLGLLLGNEAMRILEEGGASAGDVDKAMRLGYGHPMGPLELADLVGLDVRLNNLRSMYEQTSRDEYRPPAILEQLVAAGRLGRKSGGGFYDYDTEGVRTAGGR